MIASSQLFIHNKNQVLRENELSHPFGTSSIKTTSSCIKQYKTLSSKGERGTKLLYFLRGRLKQYAKI